LAGQAAVSLPACHCASPRCPLAASMTATRSGDADGARTRCSGVPLAMHTLPSIVTGTDDQEKPTRGLGISRPMLRVAPAVVSVAPPVSRRPLSQASTPSLRGWPLERSATVPENGPLTVWVLPDGSTTRMCVPAGSVMVS
jgi:hypothetical protein